MEYTALGLPYGELTRLAKLMGVSRQRVRVCELKLLGRCRNCGREIWKVSFVRCSACRRVRAEKMKATRLRRNTV